MNRDDDKGALTLTKQDAEKCCVCCFFVLHECKIQFCLVVDLFVDLHFFFFLPKSQIYLSFFGWSYIFIDEDLNLRSIFNLNENHFSPLYCDVWRPHGDRPASDRRGPSRSAELIFNQDFQGLFIYIIILALGCGDHGRVGGIIMTFRFMKNWGIEKKRK